MWIHRCSYHTFFPPVLQNVCPLNTKQWMYLLCISSNTGSPGGLDIWFATFLEFWNAMTGPFLSKSVTVQHRPSALSANVLLISLYRFKCVCEEETCVCQNKVFEATVLLPTKKKENVFPVATLMRAYKPSKHKIRKAKGSPAMAHESVDVSLGSCIWFCLGCSPRCCWYLTVMKPLRS